MKLFVDDVRACPNGWTLARTVTEAIRYLHTQDIKEVSLDHDIACRLVTGQEHTSNETYEPVARYIFMLNAYALDEDIKIRIHTSNFEMGRVMAKIMGIEYTPYVYQREDYQDGKD